MSDVALIITNKTYFFSLRYFIKILNVRRDIKKIFILTIIVNVRRDINYNQQYLFYNKTYFFSLRYFIKILNVRRDIKKIFIVYIWLKYSRSVTNPLWALRPQLI